ncbi:hypothetical protein PoB_006946300 [Plakobranchus ocellatus]|uniref:Uncharacterized protein n=1 Tax=Plakobranchus ocellatus TaxID=259542 RepID=A0AAV4DFF7_9GAST|nr:hypothetical protein PoB_006946300 [Plakobranchus ocellatus]
MSCSSASSGKMSKMGGADKKNVVDVQMLAIDASRNSKLCFLSCVFFKLLVRLEFRQASLKRVMTSCKSSAQCMQLCTKVHICRCPPRVVNIRVGVLVATSDVNVGEFEMSESFPIVDDLTRLVWVDGFNYKINLQEPFFRSLTIRVRPYAFIEEALNGVHEYTILTMGSCTPGYSMCLMKKKESFYIFDCHLKDEKGMPVPEAEPDIKVFQIKPFFNCAADYQVVGEDYTIVELDVSGNSSRYSFKKDMWPRFVHKRRSNGALSTAMLFCSPFTIPQNGFCVTKDSFPNGCSCENVGNETFRLRANFTIRIKEMSHGQISLIWPGKFGPVRYDYDLPEVKMKETQPKIYVFRKSSYFTCTEDYQVLGVDYTLLELDVSKNHSVYSYEKDRGPRFEYKTRENGKLSEAMHFCTPFTDSQKGFCVTKQSFPNGCGCEQVGVDRYRLKANFTVTAKEMSHGMLSLTWPGKRELQYEYNLPEVKARPKRDEKPEGKTQGLKTVHILGLVQGAGLLTAGGYLYFCE